MIEELVILVDKDDEEFGTMPKLQAHIEGKLHRAFSVFIFNKDGELLLQQRAATKYHSAEKWTNTCCSHPKPNESNIDAAHRRLKEEMGMSCEIHPAFSFLYRAEVENGLIEHEYDHVFFGISDHKPQLNLNEVADFKYLSMKAIEQDLITAPQQYTEWLKICFPEIMLHYQKMRVYG